MQGMAEAAVAGVAGFIILRAVMTGTDAYAAFLRGAERGMRSAVTLLPALCGMLLLLGLMNASGLTELLVRVASPLLGSLRIPEEVAPLILLRPLTGSGSLAALEQILQACGPDSRAGMIASVIMGSGETVLYTMTVYAGAAGVKKLPGVLAASMAGYLVSVAVCGLIIR